MSPKKFWKLSFYDWSLWVNRITNLQKKRDQEQELLVILQRDWFTLYANYKKGKNDEPYEATDFYQLPGDEKGEKKKVVFANPEEFEKEMRKRVRRRHK